MHHRHLFVFVLFCVVAAALVPRAEAYGEPVSSRPSYQERTVGALINAARVGTALSPLFRPTADRNLGTLGQYVRELMTCTIRIPCIPGPSGFATAYMAAAGYPASGIADGLPAQLPLYFDPKLSEAASGHSQDLAVQPPAHAHPRFNCVCDSPPRVVLRVACVVSLFYCRRTTATRFSSTAATAPRGTLVCATSTAAPGTHHTT